MFNKELLKKAGFSDKAVKYISDNKNYGEMKGVIEGSHTGSCGDTIITYLKIEDGVIKDAKFVYTGCAGSAAAGSAITELAKGKTVEEAKKLSLQSIIDFYKEGNRSIPEHKYECGEIAVNSLKDALKNYGRTIK